jgi:CPA2 family monovalent cation:H+ antiporter-2
MAPQIRTAIRTHSVSELAHFERQGVGVAIMGERELALGLLDYALKSFNVPEERSYAIMREVRKAGEGGAFDRRLALLSSASPELRPHQNIDDAGRDSLK